MTKRSVEILPVAMPGHEAQGLRELRSMGLVNARGAWSPRGGAMHSDMPLLDGSSSPTFESGDELHILEGGRATILKVDGTTEDINTNPTSPETPTRSRLRFLKNIRSSKILSTLISK